MGDRKVEALQLGMDMREELSGNTVRYTVKGIPGHMAAPDRCVNPIGLAGIFAERRKRAETGGKAFSGIFSDSLSGWIWKRTGDCLQ